MNPWLDFAQLALALGLGWVVWVLVRALPGSRDYEGSNGEG
jgi:hypothetical protein